VSLAQVHQWAQGPFWVPSRDGLMQFWNIARRSPGVLGKSRPWGGSVTVRRCPVLISAVEWGLGASGDVVVRCGKVASPRIASARVALVPIVPRKGLSQCPQWAHRTLLMRYPDGPNDPRTQQGVTAIATCCVAVWLCSVECVGVTGRGLAGWSGWPTRVEGGASGRCLSCPRGRVGSWIPGPVWPWSGRPDPHGRDVAGAGVDRASGRDRYPKTALELP
jgi:hypothetical protein